MPPKAPPPTGPSLFDSGGLTPSPLRGEGGDEGEAPADQPRRSHEGGLIPSPLRG